MQKMRNRKRQRRADTWGTGANNEAAAQAAAAKAATKKAESVSKTLGKLEDSVRDLLLRANLILGPVVTIQRSVENLGKALGNKRVTDDVLLRVNRVFGQYVWLADGMKKSLDPYVKEIVSAENDVDAKLQHFLEDFNAQSRDLRRSRQQLKDYEAKFPGERGELHDKVENAKEGITSLVGQFRDEVNDHKKLRSITDRLPDVLKSVSAALGKVDPSSHVERLTVEIKKRKPAADRSNAALESWLSKNKDKLNDPKVMSLFNKAKEELEFQNLYVRLLLKAADNNEMVQNVKDQISSAKDREIPALLKLVERATKDNMSADRLPPMHPGTGGGRSTGHGDTEGRDFTPSARPTLSPEERDVLGRQRTLKPGELPPMHPMGKKHRKPGKGNGVKHFRKPRISSARERLRKVAKRIKIINYLRHKSL